MIKNVHALNKTKARDELAINVKLIKQQWILRIIVCG